ncbi:hypothetical protein [Laceyella putida]|uniref:Uncharacterized protein n=1 Tax=Laceyella putida TaxID=110101 RepID=A0ABW2RGZ0_9BACL
MDTRWKKRQHMLLSNHKPIKHNLLENHYKEKKAEITSDHAKGKSQNSYKKWSVMAAALSLLLIIAAWYALSAQQENKSKITAKTPSSPATDPARGRKPTVFTNLRNQQTVQHLDPAPVSETINQPSPKQKNATESISKSKPSETNAPSKTSVHPPSPPPEPTDQTKPAEPTNPPPSQDDDKPQKEEPECKPSIWNWFQCND